MRLRILEVCPLAPLQRRTSLWCRNSHCLRRQNRWGQGSKPPHRLRLRSGPSARRSNSAPATTSSPAPFVMQDNPTAHHISTASLRAQAPSASQALPTPTRAMLSPSARTPPVRDDDHDDDHDSIQDMTMVELQQAYLEAARQLSSSMARGQARNGNVRRKSPYHKSPRGDAASRARTGSAGSCCPQRRRRHTNTAFDPPRALTGVSVRSFVSAAHSTAHWT
jgi:hypothetical protein